MPKQKKRPHAITFEGPSMTKQSFKDETCLKNIVRRFHATGVAPASRPVRYGVQGGGDYYELNLQMAEAKTVFEELPPELKEKYVDVEGVVEALSSEEGLRELDADGIITLTRPLTIPDEENELTNDPTATQEDNSPPADPPKAENAAEPA